MRIYPAIDIKDGKCVRLYKGRFDDVTVYGDDPVEMAKRWEQEGGEFLHVVDLDGAKGGMGVNEDVIRRICQAVKMPVQTGGGIRSMDDIKRRLDCGINRVIIGTSAVKDRAFVEEAIRTYGEKIVIGIDAKDGYVAIDGWEEVSEFTAVEFALMMQKIGAKTIVYTDIATDGTLMGPNLEAMTEMASKTELDVIASGGIGDINHVKSLLGSGVEGVIIGKALYTDAVRLYDAVELGRSGK